MTGKNRAKVLLCLGSIILTLAAVKIVDLTIGAFTRRLGDARRGRHGEEYADFLDRDRAHLARFPGLNEENYPRNRYLSYAVWGYQDKSGKHVNIQNGYRRTWNAPVREGAPQKTVWFFGGSTMLGQGSPDEQTIPSHVSKMLSERMPEVSWLCENFGIGGYVSTQEIILFLRLLQAERCGDHGKMPDYVVFYDGANDYFACMYGYPFEHHNFTEIKSRFENRLDDNISSLSLRILRLTGEMLRKALPNMSKLAASGKRARKRRRLAKKGNAGAFDVFFGQSARIYNFNYRLCEKIADDAGYKIIFIYQPTLFSKRTLSEYESVSIKRTRTKKDMWKRFDRAVRGLDFSSGENIEFHDFSGIIDNTEETVFYGWGDWMHTNWLGNNLIAGGICDIILAQYIRDSQPSPDSDRRP